MEKIQNEVILSIKGLTKTYRDLTAVNNLSLDIFKGEIFGFLGPNGAGKTTTIHMICGLIPPDTGDVFINGHPLSGDFQKYKRMIGFCPQELVVWESLTCKEQLEFAAAIYDIDHRSARKRAHHVLSALGLENKKNKLAKTLSGGMKRRLNIGLAMMNEPSILILDEPQAGLDPQSRILIRDIIRSLSEKTTVILTTHDMDEADRLADRIAIIDFGKLLVLDTSDKLKRHISSSNTLEIRLGYEQQQLPASLQNWIKETFAHSFFNNPILQCEDQNVFDALPDLLARISGCNIEIYDIALRKKTLEDVFISLTGRRLRQ